MVLSCGDRGRETKHEPRTPVFTGHNTGQMDAWSQVSALEIIKTGPEVQTTDLPRLLSDAWASYATSEELSVGP